MVHCLISFVERGKVPQFHCFHDPISSKLLPYENSPWKCSGSVDKKLGEVQEEGGADGRGVGGRDGHQGGRALERWMLSPPGATVATGGEK